MLPTRQKIHLKQLEAPIHNTRKTACSRLGVIFYSFVYNSSTKCSPSLAYFHEKKENNLHSFHFCRASSCIFRGLNCLFQLECSPKTPYAPVSAAIWNYSCHCYEENFALLLGRRGDDTIAGKTQPFHWKTARYGNTPETWMADIR